MNIQLLEDRVIVQRSKAEGKTSGGIVLSPKSIEKSNRGKIVSVGPGKVLDNGIIRKMQVKKGDVILFVSHAGAKVKIDGKEYIILHETDIIAVVEK